MRFNDCMSDLDKARALLCAAPECQRLVEAVRLRDGRLSQDEFTRLAAAWREAHGPSPDDTLMAGFGWAVREENTLRWCLARLHVTIEAAPAHGFGADLTLPLGRERLEHAQRKHEIGED
jgi:hypothetical protein